MSLITYLIPVCNENSTVEEAIDKVIKFNFKLNKILIIDNGSTDGSAEKIKKYIDHPNIEIVLKEKNLGWGDTVKKAINLTSSKYLYIHHSDNEYDLEVCKEMFFHAENDHLDVVFGSRLKNLKSFKNYINALIKNYYYIATIIFTFLVNILYKKKFTDITGTKFYNLNTLRNINIISENVSYEYEKVCKLSEPQIKSKEIFTPYTPRLNSHDKKVKWYHLFVGIWDIIFTRIFRYKK